VYGGGGGGFDDAATGEGRVERRDRPLQTTIWSGGEGGYLNYTHIAARPPPLVKKENSGEYVVIDGGWVGGQGWGLKSFLMSCIVSGTPGRYPRGLG